MSGDGKGRAAARAMRDSGCAFAHRAGKPTTSHRALAERDPSVAEDARAAVEWLTAGDEEGTPALFTRRRLQLFLWYELPHKWLIEPGAHLAVAEALTRCTRKLEPLFG